MRFSCLESNEPGNNTTHGRVASFDWLMFLGPVYGTKRALQGLQESSMAFRPGDMEYEYYKNLVGSRAAH
jgi:hypothetical protein